MKDFYADQLSMISSQGKAPLGAGDLWAQRLSIFILGGLLALALTTFGDYGITWDEEVQDVYGRKLLALYTTGFADRSALSYMNLYFYGGFFDLLAAIANLFSPFGHYETRHLLGGLMGVLGYLGVWKLTRLLAGERAALAALAILATTPLLYGHNFINPKDAPFAWLTVWVCYFGCRALIEGPALRRVTVLGLGLTLGMAMGSRILAAAWLLALLGAFAVAVATSDPKGYLRWPRELWTRTKGLWGAVPIALVLMAVFWPWSVTGTSNLEVAVEEFVDFPWNSDVLWNGRKIMADQLPWNYLPLLLLYVLPEIILVGLVVAVAPLIQNVRRHGLRVFSRPRGAAFVFITAVAFMPIIACAVITPTLYNGMRHFLFVVPLLGVLAAIGLVQVLTTLTPRRPTLALIGAICVVGAVARQAWIAVDLHPNQYVYYNALAGDLTGVQGRFELDYWGSSLAEATRPVAAAMAYGTQTPDKVWKVEICGNPMSAMYYLPPGVKRAKDRADADFYIGLNITACNDAPLTQGRIISSVTRRGVVLSRAIDLRK